MNQCERVIKNVTELFAYGTFEERLEYLRCINQVGADIFGFDRVLNQRFYASSEWKHTRNLVITRDWGCDLGCLDHPIASKILVHHMVPLLPEDFTNHSDFLLNTNYLITVSDLTHRRIHYGDTKLMEISEERHPNDTCPWRNQKKGATINGNLV